MTVIALGVLPGCHRHAARPALAERGPALAPHAPRPIGKELAASTIALARVDERRIAFVSDADTSVIRRIDLDARVELAPIELQTRPGPLLVHDGRIWVLTPDGARLTVLGGFRSVEDSGTDRAWRTVASDPVAMTLSPDRRTVYVGSSAARTLVAYDTKELDRQWSVPIPREPRSVVASDDGRKLFVAHAVGGNLSVIDVEHGHAASTIPLRAADPRAKLPDPEDAIPTFARPTSLEEAQVQAKERSARARRQASRERRAKDGLPTCQSFVLAKSEAVPNRLFVPEVIVDPGEITERSSGGYGSGEGRSEVPTVAVIDAAAGEAIPASLRRADPVEAQSGREAPGAGPCILPRAAAVDAGSRTLLVACQGIDSLVAYDATATVPSRTEIRRWSVGAGPTGIAIDPDVHQAAVWSQFDHTVTIVSLSGLTGSRPPPPARIALGSPARPSAVSLGRMLFHSTEDPRISSDGRACASCHPDGRDDGLVWSTPDGPRRSIPLAGRLEDTGPFSWQGNAATVQKHLVHTFERLGGSGLESSEVDALVAYVKSLPSPTRTEDRTEDAEVALGAKVFASAKTGCSSCHSGPTFTDGALHDVGTGRAFNTPSLIGVSAGGPFFHDGRFGSLEELLRKSDGKMGRTKHLKPSELAALQAFLGTL